MITIEGKGFPVDPLNEKAPLILKEAAERLDNYIVSFGTALGLYREKEFIKGDTDIDIDIIGEDGIEEKVRELFSDYELFRLLKDDGVPMQMAFNKEGVILDISIYWGKDRLKTVREEGVWYIGRKSMENPDIYETKFGKIKFPSPIETYLEERYGDWKIPKKDKAIYQ